MPRSFFVSLLILAGAVQACSKKPEPLGPALVTRQFVERMRKVHGDLEASKSAYELLWAPARKNLQERARRASALSGRELHPGELIVPSWFAMYLVPDNYEARIDGNWAQIVMSDNSGHSATARCVREEGEWKVALELPPLAAIRKRDDSETDFRKDE